MQPAAKLLRQETVAGGCAGLTDGRSKVAAAASCITYKSDRRSDLNDTDFKSKDQYPYITSRQAGRQALITWKALCARMQYVREPVRPSVRLFALSDCLSVSLLCQGSDKNNISKVNQNSC